MSHIHLVACAMPLDILSPKSAAGDRATRLAQGDHPLEKAEQVAVLLKPIPVEPGHLVILVVRVVVAVLGLDELVAGDWSRIVDTSLPSPEDISEAGAEVPLPSLDYQVSARSVVVLGSRFVGDRP